MTDRLLTARELGEVIGLAPATVLDKWQRGELPGYRFGRAVRFNVEEVLAAGRPENLTRTAKPSRLVDVQPTRREGR